MLTLILLRHAKSSWDDPGLSDEQRPLNARGRRDAPRMGRWLVTHGLIPKRALVSPATRARQTFEELSRPWPARPAATILPELYVFHDAAPIIAAIREHGEAADPLLVIGHNPALHELARRLAGGAIDRFPTCAAAVFHVETDVWRAFPDAPVRLARFMRPKALPNGDKTSR